MTIELLGATIDLVGKILIAYTAVRVHRHVWREHRIDAIVFRAMRREQVLAFVGIAAMVIGYALQLQSKWK